VTKLDETLLQTFIETFYGYGNYAGDYWFVGMEEGCDTCDFAEISKRLSVWQGRGSHELEDVKGYHLDLGITWPFEAKPALQSTWKGLIRILLLAEGQQPTVEQMRLYQRDVWGRVDGESCLLELLPLPSRSTGHWIYADHSDLSFLSTRVAYMEACAGQRAAHIHRRIVEHRPKAVIFYSMNSWYRKWWQAIAGVEFVEAAEERLYWARVDGTTFVIMNHPTAFGVSNRYLQAVATKMSSNSTEI
jgi:hypothetical protein